MDLAAHSLAQGGIHHAVARDGQLAGKGIGHDGSLEMDTVVAAHIGARSRQASLDKLADEIGIHGWGEEVTAGCRRLCLDCTPASPPMADPMLTPRSDSPNWLAAGRRVLSLEGEALAALSARLDEAFAAACQHLLACRGRVVCTGMGKSGHIARKIAATLASTGTPAFFLHPGEASHGDLGMVTSHDVVLALSYSGESDEILTIMPGLKRLGVPLLAMTGRPASTLASVADVHLDVGVATEACPHNLAPTTSTTTSLALGDALAVAVLEARGFTREDFARSHPAGALGRRLLLRIADVMHAGDAVPQVSPTTTIAETLVEMSRGRLGMAAVIDDDGRLVGVFTDGDLRRALDDDTIDLRAAAVSTRMGRSPKTIGPDELASVAVQRMETHKITGLLVVDVNNRLVGALNFLDLLRARVV